MSKKTRKNYEVGYRRPPRSGQFKKGQSGNPCGRPKRIKTMSDRLREALNEVVTITENGCRSEISKSDAITKQLVNKAASGDLRSAKLVFEMVGPLGEQGSQVELEASHQNNANARERLRIKLERLSERLRARKRRTRIQHN